MNERMIRFIELLNQMFELDKSDLDFGIYRILNQYCVKLIFNRL